MQLTTGKRALALAWAIFIFHALALALLHRPVSGLWNNEPWIEQDYGLHFHHLHSMAAFWETDRRLWGYNPYFMAGYPSNTIQDLSIKLFELIALFAPFLGLVQGFKLSIFGFTAAIPWMFYGTAWNFFEAKSRSRAISLAAMILGTLSWWNSYPREMYFYGMVGFPVASAFMFFALSILHRFLQSKSCSWLLAGLCGVCAAIALPLHIQCAMTATPLAMLLFFLHRRRFSLNKALTIVVIAVCAVGINWPWLGSAISHRGDDATGEMVRRLGLFTTDDPFCAIKDYLTPATYFSFRAGILEKGLRLALLVFGIAACISQIRRRRFVSIAVFGAAAIMFFVLAYGASILPATQRWQPLRFKVPLDFALVPLAATFLVHCFAVRKIGGRRPPPTLVIGIAVVVLLSTSINIAQMDSSGALRVRAGLTPHMREVMDWIRREVPENTRVLFEESGDESGFAHEGAYLSAFIPWMTGREVIGGPINLYNDRHHVAEFHSGQLLRREIGSVDDATLLKWLDAYNIGGILIFSNPSIERFSSLSSHVKMDRVIGNLFALKRLAPTQPFVTGTGKIAASPNRIVVESDSEAESVELKYHWIEGLSASSNVTIEPFSFVTEDPIPFVRVRGFTGKSVLGVGNMERQWDED